VLPRHIFHLQAEIFLTLAAATRIRVVAGRVAIHPLSLVEQQTIKPLNIGRRFCMAKKAKKGDKKAPKKGK
jgi:hypothetical protein